MPPIIKAIVVSRAQAGILKRAAQEAWPLEACALLVGRIASDRATVSDVHVTRNVNDSRVTFQLDPNEQVRVYMQAEAEGKEVVGVFHSHPAPPVPSSLDLKYMKWNPVVWVIMSVPDGATSAYLMEDDAVHPVEIVVKDG